MAQRIPARDIQPFAEMSLDPALRPATLAPPPLVYAAGLFGGWWLEARYSLAFTLEPLAGIFGWALIGLGLAGSIWALAAIRRHGTTINPYKPASNLVNSGPFAHSRNPIYVSDWLVYVGVTLLLGTAWPMLLAPLVWGVMRYGVIAHEEAHLSAKFGDEYRSYRAQVRRWL